MTDGRTDRRTELPQIYRASMHWMPRAVKKLEISVDEMLNTHRYNQKTSMTLWPHKLLQGII